VRHKGNILIVDDEEFIRKMTKDLLEKSGYTVACASNTIGAGYLLKDFNRVRGVLDIMLPGSLSGDQACETLREFRPGLKIIFYSGIEEEELARLTHRHKADACVSKGQRVSTLLKVIDQLLDPAAP
jgi:CheY-like chemotaxis protein